MPPANEPEWAGVTDLQVLGELEQRICRCASRIALFGGDAAERAAYGHEGMAGLLVADAYEFLKQRVGGFPTKTVLASSAITRPVALNVLSKFLNGTPPAGKDWFAHAKALLRYMIVGAARDVDPARAGLADRIDDYFFRNFEPQDSTPFFRRARRQHGTPCSPKELAGEIAWVTRQRSLTRRPAELIWVSGGPAFFPAGSSDRLMAEVAAALRGGVEVTFVYHPGAPRRGVRANLDEFFAAHPGAKEARYRELDLSSVPAVERWWEYASAAFSHLYLSAEKDGERDVSLYHVRGIRPGEDTDDPIPLALRGTPGDVRDFLSWWGRVTRPALEDQAAASAAPPADPGRAGGKPRKGR